MELGVAPILVFFFSAETQHFFWLNQVETPFLVQITMILGEIATNLWEIYGKSMGHLWKIYGTYGKFMENLWNFLLGIKHHDENPDRMGPPVERAIVQKRLYYKFFLELWFMVDITN